MGYLLVADLLLKRLEPFFDHPNIHKRWSALFVCFVTAAPAVCMMIYVFYVGFIEALIFGGIDCWPGKYLECD